MRNDKANQEEYEAIQGSPDYQPARGDESDRHNQDEYDVIQAKEEFESMLDPRTEALKARIKELEEQVASEKTNEPEEKHYTS